MKIWNKNRGITLIALVITIIVLLILAGISISMLTGQNGILNRASEAKEKTELAQSEENIILNNYEKTIDKFTSNLPSTDYTMPYLPDSIKFEIVSGTDLSTGLVIREKATGSEYVWVEVPKTDTVYPTAGLNVTSFTDEEYMKIEEDLHTYTSDYRNGTSYNDVYYVDSTNGWYKNEEEYNNAKKKMLKSVYENGGFWVGRYEAGIETNRTAEGEANTIPLTKVNLYPYTYVTRTKAKVLAEKVESGRYTSSLMFGVQWDLVLKYMESKNAKIQDKLRTDSTKFGNYRNSEFILNKGKFAQDGNLSLDWYNFNSEEKISLVTGCKKLQQNSYTNGILLTTGAANATSIQNIYDMAGNVWEFTLEKASDDSLCCACRGGSYGDDGSAIPANYHNYVYTYSSGYVVGFRISLY